MNSTFTTIDCWWNSFFHFQRLLDRGIFEPHTKDGARLKVKTSEAFRMAVAESTHVFESYLLYLELVNVLVEKGLVKEIPAVEKAVYQRLITSPWKEYLTSSDFYPARVEFEEGLKERVLDRLLQLEEEGKL